MARSVQQLFFSSAGGTLSGGISVACITSLIAFSAFPFDLVESVDTGVDTGLDTFGTQGAGFLDVGQNGASDETLASVGNEAFCALAWVFSTAWFASPSGSPDFGHSWWALRDTTQSFFVEEFVFWTGGTVESRSTISTCGVTFHTFS
jgi:hypothetical protein